MGGLYKSRGVKRSRTGTMVVPEAVKKYVNRRVNASGEKKFVTSSWNFDTSTTASNSLLTGVAQGDDVGNRTGNQIRLKKVSIRAAFFANATGAAQEAVRVILYKPKDLAGLLTGGVNTMPDPQLHTVIHDKMIALSAWSANTGGLTVADLNWDFPLGGTIAQFDGTGASSLAAGQLYLYICSTTASNGPSAYGSAIVEFTDK